MPSVGQRFFALVLGLAGLCGLSACGAVAPETLLPSDTQCQTGSALILVGDSSLDRRCGCQEAAQRFTSPVNGFTCTVAAGTVVYFNFDSGLLWHQVRSVGTPSFASSPVFKRDDKGSPRTYAFKFLEAGAYEFQDTFDASLSGRIVVQ